MKTKVTGFQCGYCPTTFLRFKSLINHYRTNHSDKLRRYDIINTKLKQTALYPASKPEEIMQCLGWDATDCTVKEIE